MTPQHEAAAPRVVVPHACFRRQRLVDSLTAAGVQVLSAPPPAPGEAAGWLPADLTTLREQLASADAVVCWPQERYSADLLEASDRLRVVTSMVIGTDNIDVETATRRSVLVAHGAAKQNYDGMAESVVLFVTSLLHRLKAKEQALRLGTWRPTHQGSTVSGRTIGLVGFGRIGAGVAERLQGWDVELVGADPHVPHDRMGKLGVRKTELDELLTESDVVCVQVTLTPETRGMISGREIARMKPTAYLVNTARGGVVDEADLAAAITNGTIAGAAVDVWSEEPPAADNPLLRASSEDLILTGHNVGHAETTYDVLATLAADQVLAGLRGETPAHVRNPAVLDSWHRRSPLPVAVPRVGLTLRQQDVHAVANGETQR